MQLILLLLKIMLWQSEIEGKPSGRTVYNIHTRPAHWASAVATCAEYDAHLVTVDNVQKLQADLDTLDQLDWDGAFQGLISSDSFWTGLYRSRSPDRTDNLAWDTCTTFTGASSPNNGIANQLLTTADFCTSMADGYQLEPRSCDQQLPFVCQLELGQCWFLPLDDRAFLQLPDILTTGDVHECARACRNYTSSNSECWGFVAKDGACKLYIDTRGHVYVRDPTNYLQSDSDSTAHVKICTGGWVTNTEPVFSPVITEPDYQNCSYTAEEDWNPGVCYCDCQAPPTVLSPDYLLSSPEEKAEQITAELLVKPSDTSKAQRKLVSAEDSRPSAQSVGSLGILVMVLVFGGLVVLDLDVLWRHMKGLVESAEPHPQQKQTQHIQLQH